MPVSSALASLRFTLTATPMAMELELVARDMAAPVPSVRKSPWLMATMFAPLAAWMLPATWVLAMCLLTVTPTAAATCTFCCCCCEPFAPIV